MNTQKNIYYFGVARLLFLCILLCAIAGKPLYPNQNCFQEQEQNDTISLLKMIQKAERLLYSKNIDSAMSLTLSAYHQSLNKSFQYGVAHCNLVFGKIYQEKKRFPEALSYYLKCFADFKKIHDLVKTNETLKLIGNLYFKWEVFPKALEYYKMAMNQNTVINEKCVDEFELIANTYDKLNINDSAIYYFEELCVFHKLSKDTIQTIKYLKKLVDAHLKFKQYNSSLKYQKELLNIYRTQHDNKNILLSMNNIGFLYKNMGESNKSLKYFKKVLELCNDNELKASVLINIAVLFFNKADYDKAKHYLYNALKYRKLQRNDIEMAKIYNFLASTYLKLEENETALNYTILAFDIGEQYQESTIMKESLEMMAMIYQVNGAFESALHSYKKYVYLTDSIDKQYTREKAEAYLKQSTGERIEKEVKLFIADEELQAMNMKQLLLQQEKQEKELDLLKKQQEFQQKKYEMETEVNEQNLLLAQKEFQAKLREKEIAELNKDREIKKLMINQQKSEKEKIIQKNKTLKQNNQILEKERELQKLKAERERVLRVILILAFAASSIVLFLILYGFLKNRRLTRLLKLQNAEINNQKEEIQAQAEELKVTNEHLVELSNFKEAMTGMIVHDLKNPLNTILHTSGNKKIIHSAKQMLTLVLNILDVQKFEEAEIQLHIKQVSLNRIIHRALEQVYYTKNEKNIQFINDILSINIVEADEELMVRVLINILTNALKYTPVNGKIKMHTSNDNEGFVRLWVTDSGIGIPKDMQDVIFEKFKQVQPVDIGTSRSTGLGLTFCKLAVKAQKGNIGVNSEENKGASFWIELPLVRTDDAIENLEQAHKKEFHLSQQSIQKLKPLFLQLRNVKFYEITKIHKIIKHFNFDDNQELLQWKEHFMNAVNSSNKNQYNKLVNTKYNE